MATGRARAKKRISAAPPLVHIDDVNLKRRAWLNRAFFNFYLIIYMPRPAEFPRVSSALFKPKS